MVKTAKRRRPRRRRKTRTKKRVHIIPMGRIARKIQRGKGRKKKRKATRKKSRNSPRLNPSVMGLMESAKAENHTVPQTNLALYRAKLT